MAMHTPSELTVVCCQVGEAKGKRSTAALLLLAALAGAIIALSGAAANTAVYGIADVWTARTVAALVFPLGLGILVVLGGELFTGNCLMSASLLDGRTSWHELGRNWLLVYVGNILGAALVAWLCVSGGHLDYSGGQLALYTMKVAAAKSAIPFWNGLALGVLCNLLVCMGVLVAMSAKDTSGKLLGAYWPVFLFVLCGFEHCVANMYYLLAGLMAAARPEYAALAAQSGLDLGALSLTGVLVNLVPVTLGNILGGAGLGALLWLGHRGKKEGQA